MSADAKAALSHVSDWVFDLDNTLYPATCDLFAQIDVRMTAFVSDMLKLGEEEARAVQKRYYAEHGTTLAGLMTLHDMEPAAFLEFVHDIDLSPIPDMPELVSAIAALPGRKYVYTNGSVGHAERVSAKLGIRHLIDGVHGIESAGYVPKPAQGAYEAFIATHNVAPHKGAFFEDLERNLVSPAEMGFATVLVTSDHDWSHEPEGARPGARADVMPGHVHFETDDLAGFLKALVD